MKEPLGNLPSSRSGPAALLLFVLIFCSSSTCAKEQDPGLGSSIPLEEVGHSDLQWTGVAVGRDGRVFVNYPFWAETPPVNSVAVLSDKGEALSYPTKEWNSWSPLKSPQDHFVCVQSVFTDTKGYLWVLDPANPRFQGVIQGGPKLIRIDTELNGIAQTIRFDDSIAPKESYLNDVRVDSERGYAYITDSGLGAIVVVDLATEKSRRLLAGHPSTKSEGLRVVIDGKEWRRPDGSVPVVHSDGIALDHAARYLYYQALTGRTLYRIDTAWLRDESISEKELETKVETVAQTGPADGMIFGPDGYLYLSGLEGKSIKRYVPHGAVETVVKDSRLEWPDSFSIGPDGWVYVTTSQINLGQNPASPYRIFRFKPR